MKNWSLVGHFVVLDNYFIKRKNTAYAVLSMVLYGVPDRIRTCDRRLRRAFILVFTVFLYIFECLEML